MAGGGGPRVPGASVPCRQSRGHAIPTCFKTPPTANDCFTHLHPLFSQLPPNTNFFCNLPDRDPPTLGRRRAG